MLLEMCVKNYVLIEEQKIAFEPGLNIITGETGSGKSLVIDALSAVTGGKFTKEDIRTGEKKSSIEALFSLEGVDYAADILDEYGIEKDADESLIITREVNAQGRSICRINGQIVTLTMLRRITQYLVDIVGQNEHQLLFNIAKHGKFVDNYGGDEISLLMNDIRLLTDKLGSLRDMLDNISGNTGERERKLDLLKYQIEEIDGARLKLNEDEELKSRRNLLINSEKLMKGIGYVYNCLFSGDGSLKGVMDLLSGSASSLRELALIDESIESQKNAVEEIIYRLEDIKAELREYIDSIEFNSGEIDLLEERVDLINNLKRKYGNSIENILLYRDDAIKQFRELTENEKLGLEIENQIEEIKKAYNVKAKLLSEKRKDVSAKLEKLIERELRDLNMYGSRFKIKIESDGSIVSANGFDKIEFLISPNPGEPEKPLCKIASGGEMSRVMLAIKNTFSEKEKAPCIVFDEVDAGVGGQTANMVGQKIKAISNSSQILCITHLPQIACLSDNHIYVEKSVLDNKTFTKIRILDTTGRIEEIARMLGGDENIEASMAHAKELVGKI